jgi:thiopeptide-type bacteriocin biosynthesis protein
MSFETQKRLVEAVIESFPLDLPPRAAKSLSLTELAQLSYLRHAFVAAGAARLAELTALEQWLQVNVSFHSATQRGRFLGAVLADRVDAWIAEGVVKSFFFMRKPPGARLRFCVANTTRFRSELVRFLNQAKRTRLSAGHEFGMYDAETYQFGGEIGMALYHQHATIDSLAVLRLSDLMRRRRCEADTSLLSLALLNQMIRNCVGDEWELWDVWSNMRLTHRSFDFTPEQRETALAELGRNREVLARVVYQTDRFVAGLTAAEREILERHAKEHQAWGKHVRAAIQKEQLLYPIRKILPFYIVFQWNRFGLSMSLQITLSFFMQELLDPKTRAR